MRLTLQPVLAIIPIKDGEGMEKIISNAISSHLKLLEECAAANKGDANALHRVSEALYILCKICRECRFLQPESACTEN